MSSYTANLAAFFTVKNAENPIHNLEDILRTSYQVAVVHSGSAQEFFKTSHYETHIKIWHRIQAADSFVQNPSQGVDWVREREKVVFISDGPIVRHAANQPPCNLMTGTASPVSFKPTNLKKWSYASPSHPPGGVSTALCGLCRDMQLHRVWFLAAVLTGYTLLSESVLNRV